MKKLLLIILCLILTTGIIYAASPFASTSITENKLISCDGKKVFAAITVANASDIYSPELYYTTTLSILKPIEPGSLVTSEEPYYQFEPVKFDLGAYEEKILYLEYTLPDKLPHNTYTLSPLLYSNTTTISTYEESIYLGPLGNTDETLTSTSKHYWPINNIEVDPESGPNFKFGETPIGTVKLKSTFKENITAIPEYTVYKRLRTFEREPINVSKGEPINFAPGETKKIKFKFPTFNEPDSYEILVKLVDSDGNQISQEFPFRYVLKGATAKILSTNASYDATSDSIKVTINAIGPADGSTIDNCTITYRIYNETNNSLIKEETVTHSLSPEVNIIENLLSDIDTTGKIKVEASIEYEGKELANSSTTINLKKTIKTDKELFSDLVGTKYYEAVEFLNSLGILNGYPDDTFKPDNNITRAEFTVIATKLAKLNASDATAELIFNDVVDTHWAKDFIRLAYEKQIISGYPDGTFKPDNNVTYQEALTILINVMNYKDEVNSSNLNWPENYIEFANYLNMMRNLDEIDYTSPATRGNVALLTMEAYIKLKEI